MALNKKLVLELAWILPSVAIPIALLVAIVVTGFGMHITVPDDEGVIDVNAIDQTEPFDEPGVFEVEPGRYQVVMIASTFLFDPTEVTVPAGSEVEFVITSRDVLHGFHVEKTNANVMLIPGRIARVEATFEDPGEYRFVCHEYCGAGHHIMYGTVIVEEAS
jgi:cytochrome c oxidase subunit II